MEDNTDIIEELENEVIDMIENNSGTNMERRIEIYYATESSGHAYIVSANCGELIVDKISINNMNRRIRWVFNGIEYVTPVIKGIFYDVSYVDTKELKIKIHIEECLNEITWNGGCDKKEVVCEAREIVLETLETITGSDVRYVGRVFVK